MELNHPEGTHELYEHLGVHNHGDLDHGAAANSQHTELQQVSVSPVSHNALHDIDPELEQELEDHRVNAGRIMKNILPYVAVFILAVAAFLIFFTHTSFSSFFGSLGSAKSATANKTVIPASQQAAYNAWIKSYFYDVQDTSVLAPDYDISGDGLTNYQKFLLGLDPLKKDTLGLGQNDTQSLMNGIDPSTGNKMTDAQKQFVAANVDLEGASNKLSLDAANQAPQVAGVSTNSTDSSDSGRNNIIVDDNISGTLDIPALKISVPIVWTKDAQNLDKDLTNGVVHYPGTPMPGTVGTSYISGHSSNYAWIKSKYNDIFAKLGDLKQNDSFTITVKDTSGKTIIFHYVITGSGVFDATDQQQFASNGKSVVALSTCWPVGTSSKRLVVFAQLTQIEQ